MVARKPVKSDVVKAPPRSRAQAESPADSLAAKHRASLPALRTALGEAMARLAVEKILRHGAIVVHSGSAAGGIVARADDKGVAMSDLDPAAPPPQPTLEVIGDPRRIAAIIRGEKDARMQFFAGGIRVRGDMAYLSAIGMKLGFLDRPLL